MIKVSVVMPSLNVADYIGEAIDSVTHQTLDEIEIICIDAGSTDGTWEIISDKACNDERIKVLKSDVRSYGYQVNMGIEASHGEYVAILETDDYVDSGMYEELYNVAIRDQLDYVKCNYSTYTTDSNGKRQFIKRIISNVRMFYDELFAPSEYPELAIDDWYLWNGIYKRRFLIDNDIKFSETAGAAFQDIGFLHRVSVAAKKVRFVNKSLYRYCVDREGASSNSSRTLSFIRQEYGLLLDDIKYKMDYNWNRLLYVRMGKSYVRACMDTADDVMTENDCLKLCDWLTQQMVEAVKASYVTENDMPYGMRDYYRCLLDSVETFIDNRRERRNRFFSFLESGSMIVIFGCGNYGRDARKKIESCGYSIDYYMDNNKTLWGKKVDGVEVVEPVKVNEFPKDVCYVIANEKYGEEIKNQLCGYCEDARTYLYTLI